MLSYKSIHIQSSSSNVSTKAFNNYYCPHFPALKIFGMLQLSLDYMHLTVWTFILTIVNPTNWTCLNMLCMNVLRTFINTAIIWLHLFYSLKNSLCLAEDLATATVNYTNMINIDKFLKSFSSSISAIKKLSCQSI